MGRLSLAIGTAALLCLGGTSATAAWWDVDHDDHRTWKVALSGGAFRQDLDGRVRVDSALGSAMVDADVLDLEHEDSGWGEVDLQLFQKHHLRLLYLPIEFDGDAILELPIRFGDISFDISDRVTSELKIHTYEVSYRYDIYLGKRFTISPLLTVSLVDAKLDVADETLGLDWEEHQLVPFPELGLRIEAYPFARLGLFVEAKGFTIGDKATEWDVQGGASLHLNKHFLVSASYRVIDYDVDWFGVVIDTRFKGPFFGAHVVF